MQKEVVFGGLALVLVAVLLFFYNIKSSWEVLPVYPPLEMPGSSFQDWHLFPDPNKEFQISFPTLPQHIAKDGPGYHDEIYAAQKPDQSYLMLVARKFTDPTALNNSDKALKEHVDKAVESSKANNQVVNFKGQKAIKFHSSKDNVEISGLAFKRDHTIYTLMRVGRTNDNGEKDFEHFANSFQSYEEKNEKN